MRPAYPPATKCLYDLAGTQLGVEGPASGGDEVAIDITGKTEGRKKGDG